MAKRQGVNKTKAVLDYWKAHPEASAGEIAEALTKAGVPIKASYVANIKTKSKQRRQVVKTAVKAAVEKRGVSVHEIKTALALLKVCGTMPAAKEALAAAQEIKAML